MGSETNGEQERRKQEKRELAHFLVYLANRKTEKNKDN